MVNHTAALDRYRSLFNGSNFKLKRCEMEITILIKNKVKQYMKLKMTNHNIQMHKIFLGQYLFL